MAVDSFSSAISSLRVSRQDAQIPKKIKVKGLKSIFYFLENEEKSVEWNQVCKMQTYLSLFEETLQFSLKLFVNQFSRFRSLFASSVMIG